VIIYKTTCLINGKIYIGQYTRSDPNYLGSGKLISRAIVKYGRGNFTREILCECTSQKALDVMEKYFISKFGSTNQSVGYNIAAGARGGALFFGPHSLEVREATSKRMSVLMRGSNNPMYGKVGRNRGKLGSSSPAAKAVVKLCLTKGEPLGIYRCIGDANESVGVSRVADGIGQCCKGKYRFAYGYRWMYLSDFQSKQR